MTSCECCLGDSVEKGALGAEKRLQGGVGGRMQTDSQVSSSLGFGESGGSLLEAEETGETGGRPVGLAGQQAATWQTADTGLGDAGQGGQTLQVYGQTLWPEVVQEI